MEMKIKSTRNTLFGLVACCLLGSSVQADWKDMLNQTLGGTSGEFHHDCGVEQQRGGRRSERGPGEWRGDLDQDPRPPGRVSGQ